MSQLIVTRYLSAVAGAVIASFDQFANEGSGCGEAHTMTGLAGGQAEGQRDVRRARAGSRAAEDFLSRSLLKGVAPGTVLCRVRVG